MRAERRDPTLQLRMLANPRGEEPVSEAKPYNIPKQLVWEAFQRVKANRGAAGVDGVSLAAFEQNLKGNLYKVWNRLAGLPLGDLPWHRGNRFPRSAQEPLAGLTPSSCRSPLGQSAGTLRASSQANNWSLVSATFQRFRHVINGSLAFVLPAHT